MTAGGTRSAGFTIVETMIVLAVSSALLIVAYTFIGGRQNSTEFMVAINDEVQAIQQIINETANGYYPNGQSLSCSGKTDGTAPNIATAAGPGQGSNVGCIFLGKILTFGATNPPATMTVYPVVGNQQYLNGATLQDVESFTQARPVALGGGQSPFDPTVTLPDLSLTTQLENGLTFVPASAGATQGSGYTYVDTGFSAAQSMATFAIADNLTQYSVSGGNLNTASQRLELYVIASAQGWGRFPSVAAMDNKLNGVSPPSTVASSPLADRYGTHFLKQVDLCFASGGTNQSGKITVTGLGQLSVSLTIYNDKTCT